MSDDPYVYPGSRVLRNRLDVRDAGELDFLERRFSTSRARHGLPADNFDLKHLKSIHRHLFQDIYEWAGEIRTVEISKGDSQFQFRQYIETGMADVHARLVKGAFLAGLDQVKFAENVAPIIGDINYVHPFREGNGRTQLQYLKQLCGRAGHWLDLTMIEPAGWIEASKAAQLAQYGSMADVIGNALRQSSR